MKTKINIEEVCQPKLRLPIINISSQFLSEKSLLATISYSALAENAALYLVNAETLEEEKHVLPKGSNCGMNSFVKGNNNDLYFASHAGSSLYKFDLDSKQFQKLAVLSKTSSCFVGSYFSSSGKIYVGTYPTGCFYQYDLEFGNVKKFETIPGENIGLYCTSFIDLPDGKMLIMTAGSNPGISMFDPKTETCEIIYGGNPEQEPRGWFNGFLDEDRILIRYPHDLRVFNWKNLGFEKNMLDDFPDKICQMEKVGEDYYFTGNPSRKMFRLTQGEITPVKDGFPNFNLPTRLHHLGNREFICMGDNGLAIRFGLDTGEMRSHQVDNESDCGMGLQFLDKVPGEHVVIGAHFINSQMFRIDLSSGKCESSINKVVPNPGQLNCGTTFKGKYYIGSYVGAVISEYDWNKSYIQNENPCVVMEIGQGQNRPVDMVNDGTYIYIATVADYGKLGGAITVFDPDSGEYKVYRDFVDKQNPTGIFYHPESRLLVGGTNIYGDCGTAKSGTDEAVLFLWDTVQRKTVFTCSPWKLDTLKITDMSPAGVCLGTKNQAGNEGAEYFLWDIESRNYEIKPWPLPGIFIGGTFMNDREFYGATEHGLFVLDVQTSEYEMLTETTKETGSYCTRCFERLNDNEFLFDIEGIKVMKAKLNK